MSKFELPKDIHQALVEIAEGLRSGKLRHVPVKHAMPNSDIPEENLGFNMSVWNCGCACCIGGWLDRKLPGFNFRHETSFDTADGEDMKKALYRLFHPPYNQVGANWDDITPVQAAAAIDNFLAHGDSNWRAAIEQNPA